MRLARLLHPRTFVAAAALLAVAAPALAFRAPTRDAQSTALLRRMLPDLRVEEVRKERGVESGLMRRFWLRNPGAEATSSAAPRQIAKQFLVAHAADLGLDAANVERNLMPAQEKISPSGSHYRWNQEVNGVPVYRSEIVVKVSNRGQVSSVFNGLATDVAISTVPSIDAAKALEIATATVQLSGKPLGSYTTELTVLPLRTGTKLAWLVSMPNEKPLGDWVVFVDANTREILGVEDRMVYANGTGRVFDPDPMSKLGDSTLVDNNDADAAVPFPGGYDTRNLLDITLNAGTYSLSGPYARITEDEAPVVAPVTQASPDFLFQRSASGFEDVMCYFHLDQSQRYIQSLGFLNINNRVQDADSHGLSGADNSHYVPSTKKLAFGEGGVDDDEDADVILHEYGHSIQDNIVPGWGGGQEGAMGEGFGDYWAGSYSLSLYPNFQPNFVFTWDGHNAFWPGRVLIDPTAHYPEDCCGEVHDSGTLWCSGLIDCWYGVGRTVMDKITLDHHFALGTSATMADAANQIIQSDIDLYGGAHLQVLVNRLDRWGFVNAEDFIPSITHTPLTDTEDVTGPYVVNATVSSTQPLTADSPKLLWGVGAAITDSVTMTPAGPPNQYTASIPGPGSPNNIRYYLLAKDTNGGRAHHPATAPTTPHVFHVGPDVTPPTLLHTPLGDTPELTWPANVNATVSDNFGVASVVVQWTINAVSQASFNLTRIGVTNNYTGTFPSTQNDVNVGDQITYDITATDVATNPNTTRSPVSGEHSFQITNAAGVVLILDNDDVAKRRGTKVVEDPQNKGQTITISDPGDNQINSANDMSTVLTSLGYVVTVESAFTSNSANWPNYSFIISASGGNTDPVANSAYRSALESYVAAGHKLIVEGGEVGYDAISTPGYPTFAANVLHAGAWHSDNAGALNVVPAQASHPIVTNPNTLPASIPIAYTGFGSEDAFTPAGGAYAVYQPANNSGDAGLLVFDNNPAPQSAQIVFFAFDFKDLGDESTRIKLLDNTAKYLLASEPPPTSSISGRVMLGQAWSGANTPVTLQPGNVTVQTDAQGYFRFPSLYVQNYTVSASKPGYQSASQSGVGVAEQEDSYIVLHLYPQQGVSQCSQPALAIPDNNATGVQTNMNIVAAYNVQSITVSVNITHTYQGDLIVELRHGAKTVRLHNRTGGTTDNIIGTYPTTLTVSGPGALANFIGDPAGGTWTLFVSDNANVDVGTINEWCLNIGGPVDSTQNVGIDPSALPKVVDLATAVPNPSYGDGAMLKFALPREGKTSLAIYDVSGRLVRRLVDGTMTAGVHTYQWNGRDGSGRALAPGLYLVRLRANDIEKTKRIAVVQ